MVTCRWCNQSFVQNKPWQEFCCTRHQQDWHLHQKKLVRDEEKLFAEQGRVEEAEERRANGHGIAEQRKKASEVLARFGGGQRPMVRRI